MPTGYQALRAVSRRIRGPLPKSAATCRRAQVRGVKTKLLRLLSFLGLILAALASLDLTASPHCFRPPTRTKRWRLDWWWHRSRIRTTARIIFVGHLASVRTVGMQFVLSHPQLQIPEGGADIPP